MGLHSVAAVLQQDTTHRITHRTQTKHNTQNYKNNKRHVLHTIQIQLQYKYNYNTNTITINLNLMNYTASRTDALHLCNLHIPSTINLPSPRSTSLHLASLHFTSLHCMPEEEGKNADTHTYNI
jgi:hypothetical protein